MDASIRPSKKYPDMSLVATTDFFYPLITDPYLMGRIGAANALSDMYAMGVAHIDSVLMILAVSTEMETKSADIVTRLLIKGFSDCCNDAQTDVNGGQTVRNPWPIVGGVAQSVCKNEDIIMPVHAVSGDVIILTKALGTQVASNFYQWYNESKPRWEDMKIKFTEDDAKVAIDKAVSSMCRLNRVGAELMHKYNAHAGTDVTGFGILGHAKNLCENQEAKVDFHIHTFPVIKNMIEVDALCGEIFHLRDGYSSETSGGLLICLPAENAQDFIDEIERIEGCPAWIIGEVTEGNGEVTLKEDLTIIEV